MSKSSNFSPFHESILPMIKSAKTLRGMTPYLKLIITTKVPTGQDKIIEALMDKAKKLNIGDARLLQCAIGALKRQESPVGKEKVCATLGIYFGMLHPNTGKLLLIRRTSSNSIVPGTSFKGNWELPGGAVMKNDSQIHYNYYFKELSRILKEKTGIDNRLCGLQSMDSVMLKSAAGYDYASVVVVICDESVTIGEQVWVSPKELAVLAENFIPANVKTGESGVGLLSGIGKRMHCMALSALKKSPCEAYASEAEKMLDEITKTWED